MSTLNVAKMFHQDRILGSIEPGKKADLVIIKPKTPNTPINSQSIYGHLVNTFSSKDVDTVIVDGKVILKEGRLITIDEEKAVDHVHRVVEKLWDKLLSKGAPQLDYIK
jgi:cytosine/adenosine deaminase-related metal-dependent hydrolase